MKPDVDHGPPAGRSRKAFAWCVHLVTALGVVCALCATLAVFQHQWMACFAWLAVAVLIDAVDGTLARWVDVKSVLPGFDGALLDNLVDFLTYVFVPVLFVLESGMLPERWRFAGAATILLSSAYQFCQGDAKTQDHSFKGFPSYWNLVVFYLFVCNAGPWTELLVVALCVVLVFIPVKYVYPSRTPHWRRLTLGLSVVWGATVLAMMALHPHAPAWLIALSMAYIGYYVALSLVITFAPHRLSPRR